MHSDTKVLAFYNMHTVKEELAIKIMSTNIHVLILVHFEHA